MKINAPFTPEQVVALARWQVGEMVHPFTCPDEEHEGVDPALVPTVRGWICPFCDYTQDWAHASMLDPPPKNPFAEDGNARAYKALAYRALEKLSPHDRGLVFCWFCLLCGAELGPETGGSCPNPNCVPCHECGSTVPMRSDYTAPDPRADGPPK